MSNCYTASNSVFDWMMTATLERVEAMDLDERKEFFDLFKTEGKWKPNSDNQWGWVWREWLEENIIGYLGLPKTLIEAMLSDCINEWSVSGGEDGCDTDFQTSIKGMASDDGLNPEDE